jgi:hypothetical protein
MPMNSASGCDIERDRTKQFTGKVAITPGIARRDVSKI